MRERENGTVVRPGSASPTEGIEAALREAVRSELRRILSARQAVQPSTDDELTVRSLIRAKIQAAQREALLASRPGLLDPDGRLAQRIYDNVMRFGPISRYLDDERIEEILVNHPQRVWLLKRGDDGVTRTELADVVFTSDEEVLALVRRIIAPLGRRIDESSPAVDARLPDGSRLHAIMPPLTGGHVAVTIRKHLLTAQTMDDLVRLGTISPEAARFLSVAVQAGVNILVCGGAASGKTTTLNCLASTLTSPAARCVTIEDTLELKLTEVLPNCIALEAREANADGYGKVTIRDLVRHALRMSPRRIIVGEVRGSEALDMLLAMSSGHPGSMSTIHADSAQDALLRLKTYVLLGGEDLPERAALELIAAAIQLVVYQTLTPEGYRRIGSIFEVTGLEGTTIIGNELYRRTRDQLGWTGLRPRCEATIRAARLRLPW
jgi:pilus assembly protein CpaF